MKSLLIVIQILMVVGSAKGQLYENNKYALYLVISEIQEFLNTIEGNPHSVLYTRFERDTLNPIEKGTVYFDSIGKVIKIANFRTINGSRRHYNTYFNRYGSIDSTFYHWVENGVSHTRRTTSQYDSLGRLIKEYQYANGFLEQEKSTFYYSPNSYRTDYLCQDSSWYTVSSLDPTSNRQSTTWFTGQGQIKKKIEAITIHGQTQFYQEINEHGLIVKLTYSILDTARNLWIYNIGYDDRDSSFRVYDPQNKLIKSFHYDFAEKVARNLVYEYNEEFLIKVSHTFNDTLVKVDQHFYDTHGNIIGSKHSLKDNPLWIEYEARYNDENQKLQEMWYEYKNEKKVMTQKIDYNRIYTNSGVLSSLTQMRRDRLHELITFEVLEYYR